MGGAEKLWLGTPDRFARLRRIEMLDPEVDFREIVQLFSYDFRSIMLLQGLYGFLMTFASPRISRILGETGELEHRVAKRIVDTILLSSAVLDQGFSQGAGREAARRVNAMHRRYDIHEDDFVAVGCDEALCGLAVAEQFGWRAVTDIERKALRNYYDLQSRAYGSRRPLPPDITAMKAFWSDYLEQHARFEPQNRRLAKATLGYFAKLFPAPLRPLAPAMLLGALDPRITRACGLGTQSRGTRWMSHKFLSRMGKLDPVPDNAPDGLGSLVAQVYPDGWELSELGTHIRGKPAG
jgi:uncharacterized protein (DUF2236 family)